jgi:putative ABC transport system permease protein
MWLSQVAAVTVLNLRNLRERLGSSAVAVLGIAGVVGILVAVLSIAEGFRAALESSGSPEGAIVLRAGATSEMVSGLGRDSVRIIGDAPGLERGEAGSLASAELFVVVDLPKRTTGTVANVPLRGVEPAAFQVRRRLRLVEGRMFEEGKRELIAGVGAAREFAGLEVGAVQRWGENEWTVVGLFEAGGTLAESELWTDVRVLQPAYRRGDSFQAVYARLESPQAFDRFKDALTTDPRLNVSVERESDYYAEQSRVMTVMITRLGVVIAVIMGLGAAFGAVNTMYTAVSARSREIATLRALGFTGAPVVLSVLIEALLLGLLGGLLGGGLAYLAFNGFATSTMNWQSFSQVAFTFAVTPRLLTQGIAYALVLGLVGGLFPAWRAARLPVARALREL